MSQPNVRSGSNLSQPTFGSPPPKAAGQYPWRSCAGFGARSFSFVESALKRGWARALLLDICPRPAAARPGRGFPSVVSSERGALAGRGAARRHSVSLSWARSRGRREATDDARLHAAPHHVCCRRLPPAPYANGRSIDLISIKIAVTCPRRKLFARSARSMAAVPRTFGGRSLTRRWRAHPSPSQNSHRSTRRCCVGTVGRAPLQ